MAEESYQRIQAEILDNIEEIDSSLVQFDVLIEDLSNQRRLLDSLKENFDGVEWSYSHPVLSADAWKTASITNAVVNMDPVLVADLADMYAVQEMYTQFGFKFFDRAAELARYRDDRMVLIEIIETHYIISKSIALNLRRGYADFIDEYGLSRETGKYGGFREWSTKRTCNRSTNQRA